MQFLSPENPKDRTTKASVPRVDTSEAKRAVIQPLRYCNR
jgi:hypothetical protein